MQHLPSIRRLQLFDALACHLNFRKSAQAMNIAQPALTRAIRQLEESLGFALLVRTTRSVDLTPAGHLFHLHVQRWLQEMNTTLNDCRRLARSEDRRHLVLGYSAQAAQGSMSQHLFRFGLQHSDTELHLRQLPSEAAYEEVIAGSLDGAFVLHDATTLENAGLHSVPLEQQALVVLCSMHHPLARSTCIAAAELNDWPMATGSPARWRLFRQCVMAQLQVLGISPQWAYEADDTPLLLEAIAQGGYLGLYGSSITAQLPASLTAIPLKERVVLPLSFVWRPVTHAALADLVKFLEKTDAARRVYV